MITLILRDTVNNRDWSLQTEAETLLIGRNRDAQVCIRDRSVSKNHCRIDKKQTGYRFKDLGSRNGTYINDLRCDSGPIENGDELKVGNFLIVFQTGAEGQQPALPGAAATGPSPFDQPPGNLDLDEDFDALMEDATMMDFGGEDPFVDQGAAPATPQNPMAPQNPVMPQGPAPGTPQQQPPPQFQSQSPPMQQAPAEPQFTPQQGGGVGAQNVPGQAPPGPGRPPGSSAKTRKFSSRRKKAPVDSLGDELFPDEQLLRSSSKKWETSHVVLFTLFSALLGIAVGVLVGRKWDGSVPPEGAAGPGTTVNTPPPAGKVNPPGTADPSTGGNQTPAPPAPAALDPTLEPLLGKRADLSDYETSTRHCMRLFLDCLDRTPNRNELAKYRNLDHEGRWKAIQTQAAAVGSPLPVNNVGAMVQLFLGPDRLLTPKERDQLMLKTGGKQERIGFTMISSQLYSGKEHSRPRSLRQRARSLLVDLQDKPPAESDTKDVRDALKQSADNPEEILSIFIESADADGIGPSGSDKDQWIRDNYLRFLQRLPDVTELGEARGKIDAEAEGWRKMILGLTLKRGYSTY